MDAMVVSKGVDCGDADLARLGGCVLFVCGLEGLLCTGVGCVAVLIASGECVLLVWEGCCGEAACAVVFTAVLDTAGA